MAREMRRLTGTSMLLFLALALAGCSSTDGENSADNGATNNATENNATENNATENNSAMNTPPVADAGENQIVFVGDEVEVNAAASYDADGDVLTVTWSLEPPEGSEATLEQDGFRAKFTPDVPGQYKLTLVVNDGTADSAEDRVYVRADERTEPPNNPPVADAGEDVSAFIDQDIKLDGTGSSDPDDDALTYAWLILSRPTGSAATLDDPAAAEPRLLADLPGLYEVQLEVSDGEDTSSPDTVLVNVMDVTPTNTAPVAIAGQDLDAEVGDQVILDGSLSYDDDGDELTFQWAFAELPMDSQAALADAATATPSFTPDVGGRYVVELVVDDGVDVSAPDQLVVDVTGAGANAPVAVLPAQISGRVGVPLQLDGTMSYDDDGDPLTYQWRLLQKPMGSFVLLQGATTATPTLTPDVEGDYIVQLQVSDGTFTSPAVTTTVSVRTAQPSCLIISEYIEGSSNNKAVELYNCGMGPVDLSFVAICLISNANTECSTTTTLSGTLGAGEVHGVCNSNLDMNLVDAGDCDATSGVTNFNGDDRLLVFEDLDQDNAFSAADVILDAFGETSADPGSRIWEDATYRRCDLTPYDGQAAFDEGAYQTYPVDDFSDFGVAPSMSGCMPTNTAPVADAGVDRAVLTGAPVQLDGTNSSDAENDPLTFTWTLKSAPATSTATLMDATTATPSLTPDVDGAYVIELVVNDGAADSAPDEVTLTANTPPMGGECLRISEYIEGSSNNKAVELYNCDSAPLDLSTIRICRVSNAATSCSTTTTLSGTLGAGEVHGVCNSGLDMNLVDAGDCDTTSSVASFNGDDRLLIWKDMDGDDAYDATTDVLLDAFGDPSTQPSPKPWEDVTLKRCDFTQFYMLSGPFDYSLYYTSHAQDDFSTFGDAPAQMSCP